MDKAPMLARNLLFIPLSAARVGRVLQNANVAPPADFARQFAKAPEAPGGQSGLLSFLSSVASATVERATAVLQDVWSFVAATSLWRLIAKALRFGTGKYLFFGSLTAVAVGGVYYYYFVVPKDQAIDPLLLEHTAAVPTCPITLRPFIDPVMAEDGHSYERSAIQSWFDAGHKTSPLTREQISTTLLPNRTLRSWSLSYHK
ncbi:U-box domain-containing protein 15 [Diplonema papillatum]|nr:U-box domain-containing protein 15 [Diplonema papillatum]